MELEDESYVYRKKTYIYSGDQVYEPWSTDWVAQYMIPIMQRSAKNSVDTGCFRAGDFRLNPYSVSQSGVLEREGPVAFEIRAYISYPDRYWKYEWKGCIHYLYANNFDYTVDTIAKSESSDLGPIALQKAMAKVGASRLQMAVEFGELKETFQMLKDPFGKFRNFFLTDRGKRLAFLQTAIQAAKSKRGRRWMREQLLDYGSTFASTWMEYRYGLRPLVMSIEDIFKEIHRKSVVFDKTKIRTCKSQVMGVTKETTGSVTTRYTDFKMTSDWTAIKQSKFNASVCYKSEYDRTDLQNLMLSPEYLPEIIWELTRLSFVADWIFTIGPWLESYRLKPGIRILGNTVGRKHTVEGIAKNAVNVPLDGGGHLPDLLAYNNSYERVVNEDLSSTPLWDLDVDLYRTVDSISLLWEPLRKALRKALSSRPIKF